MRICLPLVYFLALLQVTSGHIEVPTTSSTDQLVHHKLEGESDSALSIRGGFSLIPAGYNPLGYKITDLGLKFLEFNGALDCDVGRFLAGMKTGSRKSMATIKEQWLEIVRVSKQGQSMRIYRTLDDLISFCVKAGFLN